jgi:cytochrome c553
MNKKTKLLTGLACIAMAGGAWADAAPLRSLAASCAVCHGTHGIAPPGMQTLAGQSWDALLQKLRDFKTDTTPGTLMPQLAKGYSDDQLAQLAGYFSGLKP